MEKNDIMMQLQSYRFAAHDFLLYLDTHPDDKKAFAMFKDLVTKYMALVSEYEKNYGPLTGLSSALQSEFNWLNSPWPWEKEANKHV